MKKTSTLFLQIVIILLGILVLFLLLREPHTEGVNAGKAFFAVYLDPFIWLVYAGSIPFFTALYQTVKILGHVGQGNTFSQATVKALRTIKYCAVVIIGFVIVEELFIMMNHGNDDATGGFMMGVFITFGSIVVATAATVFERSVQSAVDMKSENDLTV